MSWRAVMGVAAAFAVAACGGDDSASATASATATASASATASATGAGGGGGSATASASVGTGGAGGAGGSGGAPMAPTFSVTTPLSDPTLQAFTPAVGARDGACLVAWHEFANNQARVAYVVVTGGVPGPIALVADPFGGPKRPDVAVTQGGWVIAYQANDGQADVVRAVELDATGAVVAGPDTISAPGVSAAIPKVVTDGTEEAFAWTDGSQHFFALRGAGETLGPTPVGTTLLAQGILNFPRIALAPSGELFLAYRDGGVDTTQWEVLLVTRPKGGAFGAPVNVSKSPGLLSDDIDLALEPDGTLDVAWVDQGAKNVNAFEVEHATRAADGTLTKAALYGQQDLWTWTPSIVPGLAAVWYATAGAKGPFYYGAPGVAPTPILGAAKGNAPSLARSPDGVLHLAFADDEMPSRIVYAETR